VSDDAVNDDPAAHRSRVPTSRCFRSGVNRTGSLASGSAGSIFPISATEARAISWSGLDARKLLASVRVPASSTWRPSTHPRWRAGSLGHIASRSRCGRALGPARCRRTRRESVFILARTRAHA